MKLKLAGAAMVLGGILLIARIAPVVAGKPDHIAFPPETTADLVQLSSSAGSAWPLAHVVGLLAVVLLGFGYWRHGEALAQAGYDKIGRIGTATAGLAFGLFAVALVVDGFLVYRVAAESAAVPTDPTLLAEVARRHELALSFFAPAIFAMFVAMGLLSSRIIHGLVHQRWLGVLGMLISVAATGAYIAGLTGRHWENMEVGGLAIMAGFIWHIVLGLTALFGQGIRIDENASSAARRLPTNGTASRS